jgi:hypothetical protein
MRRALQTRASLLPHLYTATREAFDTGLSPLRPMYYAFPESDGAYGATAAGDYAQYLFGADSMLVAPVVRPASAQTGLAQKDVWIPPGLWLEKDTGVWHSGGAAGSVQGAVLSKSYDLQEIPVFLAAGSVFSSVPVKTGATIGQASQQYAALHFCVVLHPSVAQGSVQVYEDDGMSVDYLNGAYAWTSASYALSGDALVFTVTSNGAFAERPAQRNFRLQLLQTPPPASVQVNGVALPYSRWGGAGTWTFDGNEASVVIDMGSQATSAALEVAVTFNPGWEALALAMNGLKGGVAHATWAKQNLDVARVTPGSNTVGGGLLDLAAVTGDVLSYQAGTVYYLSGIDAVPLMCHHHTFDPPLHSFSGTDLNAFQTTLKGFPNAFQAALSETQSAPGVNPQRLAYSVALLQNVFVSPALL